MGLVVRLPPGGQSPGIAPQTGQFPPFLAARPSPSGVFLRSPGVLPWGAQKRGATVANRCTRLGLDLD